MIYKLKSNIKGNLKLHVGNGVFIDIPENGYFCIEVNSDKTPIELKTFLFNWTTNGSGNFVDSYVLIRSFTTKVKPIIQKYVGDNYKVFGSADGEHEYSTSNSIVSTPEPEVKKRRRRKRLPDGSLV